MTTTTRPRNAGQASTTSATGRLGLVAAAVAAVTGLVGGRTTATDQVNGYGIINALPPVYWVGIAIGLVASVLLFRAAADDDHRFGAAIPVLWILLLHTAPQLAHAHARFPVTYIHLGFIQLIDDTRTGNILIDARFAWPGFFGVFISSLPDLSPAVLDWVLRLWPTMITLATAGLVGFLAQRSYPTLPLISPVSSLVFVVLSWAGQDYFSPQSVAFLLYLAIITVIESGPLRARGAWSSAAPLLSRFATAGGDRPGARGPASFVVLLVLSFGAIVSHPLAPFFVCTGLAMLGFYGRQVAWRLLVVVGVGYLLWIAIAAEPWWSSQSDYLLEQLANLSNIFTSARERGSTPDDAHATVLLVRSALGLFVFVGTLVLGTIMSLDRFRGLRPALPLAPLAGIPVVAAAVQSYGGEMIIRVFLFTLPMASILMARMLLTIPRRILPVAIPALVGVLTPFFLLARYGNELFEMVTEEDAAAVETAYANAGPTTLLLADNAFLPWGYERRDVIAQRYSVARADDGWIRALRAEAELQIHVGDYRGFDDFQVRRERAENIIVVLTRSQGAWLHLVEGQNAGSLDAVAEWLSNRPDVEVLYHEGQSWVLKLEV